MKRLAGYVCFILALGALVVLDSTAYAIVQVGTCASGPPYVIARPCPANMGELVAILIVSLCVALGAGIGSAALLGGLWGSIVWAALFVPFGVGFGIVAHANSNVAIVFYGLSAMFVIMGVAPFFSSRKQSNL